MKIQTLIIAGACSLLALSACDSNKGKPISELNGLSTGDSISYYLGESLAGQYQQYAMSDTTLKGKEGRVEFLKGFTKAMEMINSGSEAYKRGLIMGMQTYGMFDQMKKNWNVELNANYLRMGYLYATKGDSVIDQQQAQQALNIIGTRMEAQRKTRNEAEAQKAVAAAAKKLGGFTDMGGNIMMKITKKVADGSNFKKGDRVDFAMEVKNMKGENIQMLSNPKAQGEIGKNLPLDSPMTKVLLSLKPGEEAQVLVPADVLLGGRADQFGYSSNDIFNVTIRPVAGTEQEAPAIRPVPAK